MIENYVIAVDRPKDYPAELFLAVKSGLKMLQKFIRNVFEVFIKT